MNKKVLYLGLLGLITLSLFAGGYLFYKDWSKNQGKKENNNPSVATVNDITAQDVSVTIGLVTISGKVVSVAGDKLELLSNDKAAEYKIDSKTVVRVGPREDVSDISKIYVGQTVSVLYNSETMLIDNIWHLEAN